jgi:hypothetical protein
MILFLAFIVCGWKFPFIGRWPDLSGIPADTWPRIREPGKWLHDMTNLGVEAVRSDSQWFCKCFSFIVEIYTAALVLWAVLS